MTDPAARAAEYDELAAWARMRLADARRMRDSTNESHAHRAYAEDAERFRDVLALVATLRDIEAVSEEIVQTFDAAEANLIMIGQIARAALSGTGTGQ